MIVRKHYIFEEGLIYFEERGHSEKYPYTAAIPWFVTKDYNQLIKKTTIFWSAINDGKMHIYTMRY